LLQLKPVSQNKVGKNKLPKIKEIAPVKPGQSLFTPCRYSLSFSFILGYFSKINAEMITTGKATMKHQGLRFNHLNKTAIILITFTVLLI
jgi:hypothetical protein